MSKENDVMPSTATSEENEIITSMEGDTVMSKENGMMTTSTMEPVMPIAKDVEVMTTYTTIPGVTTPDVADMINIATKDFSNSMPVPSVIRDIDTSLTDTTGPDWNLLAPLESTLASVDTDNVLVVPGL
ncbi:hypothetical protein ON010_g15752 [Phytophthora cinnamomi]|nr:hypothetical protein ON010_g15752 [Phytophthora cinnamomi]